MTHQINDRKGFRQLSYTLLLACTGAGVGLALGLHGPWFWGLVAVSLAALVGRRVFAASPPASLGLLLLGSATSGMAASPLLGRLVANGHGLLVCVVLTGAFLVGLWASVYGLTSGKDGRRSWLFSESWLAFDLLQIVVEIVLGIF